MSKKKKYGFMFEENDIDLMYTSSMYYKIFLLIALSRFEWLNLPPSIDERFLEYTIIDKGRILVFNDPRYNILSLPFTDMGELNYYYYPISRKPYSVGTMDFSTYTESDSVIIYNDYLHTTPQLILLDFTKRVFNVTESLDVNTSALRAPIIAECDETQKKTMEDLLSKRKNGEPIIVGNKTLDLMRLNVLPLITPQLVDSVEVLRKEKTELINEVLTYLGVNNVISKKERLVTDEANANNGMVGMMRSVCLASRKQACKEINRMFGTNIDVRYRTLDNIMSQLGLEEGDLIE